MFEQDLITGVRFFGATAMILISIVLAFVNRGRVRSAVYERSRFLVCAASLLLGIHNIIQLVGHFREESPTLCWTINLAFYVMVTPLYNMGELNLLRAGRNMQLCFRQTGIFWLVCYAILGYGLAAGMLVNDSEPWRTVTFVISILYFLMLVHVTVVLRKNMKVADSRLTDDELHERHDALRYTAKSMNLVVLFSFLTPWMGMTSSLLLHGILGWVILLLLTWYAIQFYLYGINMPELIEVTDEIVVADMMESEAECPDDESDERTLFIRQRVEQWLSERRYTNPNVTIGIALDEMGLSASALTLYLRRNTTVVNYRQWLPLLRVEEAKRVMLEHPAYSLEAVALACGYANKSSLSHVFKANEGMTPLEWLAAQRK